MDKHNDHNSHAHSGHDSAEHSKAVTNHEPAVNSAGLIILQWLTYAFWGWTLFALVWLLYIVLANMIQGIDTSDMIPYAIASSLVLLPISFVCDWFYGKKEPQKKTGAAMVVMVIHAVIFALFAIGSLISAVLILVQMMISTSDDTSSQMVWLTTLFISSLVYAATFVRTLNPMPKLKFHRVYPLGMAVLITALIVLGFVGPVAQATLTKDDRFIVNHLLNVASEIDDYIYKNNKLPSSLADVSFTYEGKEIVDRGLVEYKKEDSSAVSKLPAYDYDDLDSDKNSRDFTFYRYQLCVEYKQKSQSASYGYYNSEPSRPRGEYSNTLYIDTHPAGKVCYKQEASTNVAKIIE